MDLGFPAHLNLELPKVIKLTWTKHALMAAQEDRYGAINITSELITTGSKIVEIEVDKFGKVNKLVIRTSYDKSKDICHVLVSGGIVKTVWLNLKSDTHKTLNINNYKSA